MKRVATALYPLFKWCQTLDATHLLVKLPARLRLAVRAVLGLGAGNNVVNTQEHARRLDGRLEGLDLNLVRLPHTRVRHARDLTRQPVHPGVLVLPVCVQSL